MRLTLPRDRYPGDAAGAFFDRLSERIATLPGVRTVSAASQFPPQQPFDTQFTLERAQPPGQQLPTAVITVATPTYLDALRVPLRAGRPLAATDRLDTPPVAVVNESFVARFFPTIATAASRSRRGPRSSPRSASRPSGTSCSCSSAPIPRLPACCRQSARRCPRSTPSSPST
jgi:hypothetical protein